MIINMNDDGTITIPQAKALWYYSMKEHPNGTIILTPIGPSPRTEAINDK